MLMNVAREIKNSMKTKKNKNPAHFTNAQEQSLFLYIFSTFHVNLSNTVSLFALQLSFQSVQGTAPHSHYQQQDHQLYLSIQLHVFNVLLGVAFLLNGAPSLNFYAGILLLVVLADAVSPRGGFHVL